MAPSSTAALFSEPAALPATSIRPTVQIFPFSASNSLFHHGLRRHGKNRRSLAFVMIGSKTFEDEFAYGFDDPVAAVTFTRALRISGWLVNVKARPIHGIRLIARNSLWPRQVKRARRKRSRLDIAAAFPDVPDAGASGF